jgi:4-amino-4-deoxy-L-arabinose transferase-like glycosyltransferase
LTEKIRLIRVAIPTLLLAAVVFRFHALAQNTRFYPDEALFSTFARSAAVHGDWLLRGPLDKTPLTIYANALSMTFFGVRALPNGVLDLDVHLGEFAARVPGTFASILLVAVMYRLARDLYPGRGAGTRHGVSTLAIFLTACSPFAIAYSATALTDGLMLFFILLALMMIARGRWGWGGLFLALGFASKQQALFSVPLLLLVGWTTDKSGCKHPQSRSSVNVFRQLTVLALPTIITLALLLVWDVMRAQPGGIWGLAAVNNNPGRLIRSNEILPRLLAWADHGQAITGPGWLTVILMVLAMAAVGWRMKHEASRRATLVDVLLATYLIAYLLAHWLVAFNTYDRYLLPVLPVAVLLMARGITWVAGLAQSNMWILKRLTRFTRAALYFCIVTPMVLNLGLSALDASERRSMGGSDLRKYTGIDELAVYLNSLPLGTIIYDHWLGWELGYYLGAWNDKRRVYYPTPDDLSAGALLQPDRAPRYFPVPADQPVRPWLEAVSNTGFAIQQVYDSANFLVYELIPPDS